MKKRASDTVCSTERAIAVHDWEQLVRESGMWGGSATVDRCRWCGLLRYVRWSLMHGEIERSEYRLVRGQKVTP